MKYPILNPLIQCECGCNNFLLKYDGRGRERLFIHGHNQGGIPKSAYWQSCIIKSRKGSKHTIETRNKIKSRLKELSDNGYIFGWKKGKKPTKEHYQKLYIGRMNYVYPTKDSKPEIMMQLALELNGIEFLKHKPILNRTQVDIFIEPNICIFVDGDYWHANPEKYDGDEIIIGRTKAKDIWARDIMISHFLNINGYNVIRIWEHEINQKSFLESDRLINMIKQIKTTVKKV